MGLFPICYIPIYTQHSCSNRVLLYPKQYVTLLIGTNALTGCTYIHIATPTCSAVAYTMILNSVQTTAVYKTLFFTIKEYRM